MPVKRMDDGIVAGGSPQVSPELPAPGWRAVLAILRQLPQVGMSRAFGRIADLRIPVPMRQPILSSFARAVGIDLSETARPLADYESLDGFFVRALRDGVRSWPADPSVAGSPVDGIVGQVGCIERGRLLQAKGRHYTAARLLADEAEAATFDGGAFLTLYLSPRHYHRVHAPAAGSIPLARHVPGALLPVNAAAVAHIEDLFPRNERVLCYLDGPLGRIAVVAIGAYNVGRISAAFDPAWGDGGRIGNRGNAAAEPRPYDPPIQIRRGDEIMAFHLGSTVVVLFEPARARLESALEPGAEIRMGEPIARPVPGGGGAVTTP
ncbi:MAG: archaetidylserine decarboxylase [Longimicrobiales bacterium]